MLDCQKHAFSLDENIHYLNCAYMSPLLKVVEEAGVVGMQRKRGPQNIRANDFFEDAVAVKQLFAKLVNTSAERIALIPSVSYGMAIVGKNVAATGKKIVTVQEEFPSDVYAMHRLCEDKVMTLCTVRPPDNLDGRGRKWNEEILTAIDKDTALVNLSSVHWSDGTTFDLQAIGERAKQVGALFVVDGSQSVGATPIDLSKYKIDALVCAGYKWLLGPYTSGFIYLSEYFDQGVPVEESWLNRAGSDNFRALSNYDRVAPYSSGAGRYNMGEYSNFINLPMLKAALGQILEWTPAGISAYCSSISRPLIDPLVKNGFGLEEEHWRCAHLFGCRLPAGVKMENVQAELEKRNVFVSYRGDALRISPHLYNDAADIAELTAALACFSC